MLRWFVTLMVNAPLLSPFTPKRGTKLDLIFKFFSLITQAHLEHPLDFMWDPQFGFGIDHLVDLIPAESLVASLLLSPLVIDLSNFKSVLF